MHVYSLHTEPACKSKYALVLHFCFSQKGKPFTSSNGSFDRKVTRVWRNSYAYDIFRLSIFPFLKKSRPITTM